MDKLFEVLVLLGSLSIFLFGLKTTSISLQKLAGRNIRNYLSKDSRSSLGAVAVGMLTSASIVSSASAVRLLVGFVNSGMLRAGNAMLMVIGANLGTILFIWLLAITGFLDGMQQYSLVLAAVALPLFLWKFLYKTQIAQLILGLSIVLIGFTGIVERLPMMDPLALEMAHRFGELSLLYLPGTAFAGLLLTILLQSAILTIALSMALASVGILPMNLAAAMVIGANLGDTFDTIKMMRRNGGQGRQIAAFHFLLNLTGFLVLMLVLPIVTEMIALILDLFMSDRRIAVYSAIHVATFHSIFNTSVCLLALGFLPLIAQLLARLLPAGEQQAPEDSIDFGEADFLSTAEIALEEARFEIQQYAKLVRKMFGNVMTLIFENSSISSGKLLRKIREREALTDQLEQNITKYLATINRTELSARSSNEVRSLFSMVDDLERMADIIHRISFHTETMEAEGFSFPKELEQELLILYTNIQKVIGSMCVNLQNHEAETNIEQVYKIEDDINSLRKRLVEDHYKAQQAHKRLGGKFDIIYLDYVNSAERIADLVVNVNEGIVGIK